MITLTRNFISTRQQNRLNYFIRNDISNTWGLERAGLVQKVDVGDGKSHYEIARDQHEHLVDTETAKYMNLKAKN